MVAVPDYEVSTKLARSLIPAQVPHVEAVANSARAALLVRLSLMLPVPDGCDRGLPASGCHVTAMEAVGCAGCVPAQSGFYGGDFWCWPDRFDLARGDEQVRQVQEAIAEFERLTL